MRRITIVYVQGEICYIVTAIGARAITLDTRYTTSIGGGFDCRKKKSPSYFLCSICCYLPVLSGPFKKRFKR